MRNYKDATLSLYVAATNIFPMNTSVYPLTLNLARLKKQQEEYLKLYCNKRHEEITMKLVIQRKSQSF